MRFKDFVAQANELLAKNPELGELFMYQTSCFDDPYRFEVSGICAEKVHIVDVDRGDGEMDADGSFSNKESAEERAEEIEAEYGNSRTVVQDCVVVEGF